MLPDPLHPAIVHFPIVFTVLLPFVAFAALWRIHRGAAPMHAWALTVGLAVALALSSWVALETGEDEEETVEKVVAEAPMETHEAAAERFLTLSGILVVISGLGLGSGTVGRGARLVTAIATLGLVAAGVQVGHSGGELVYRHGAASAYAKPAPVVEPAGEDD